jgi:CspA family cold shock protein
MSTPPGNGPDEEPTADWTTSTAYSSSLRLEFDDGRVVIDPSPEELHALAGGSGPQEAAEPVVGVVRVWHREQGWGVVDAPEVPGGCWVHFSAVEATGYRELRAGQQVLLEAEAAEQDGYRYRATRVRVLEEGHPGA